LIGTLALRELRSQFTTPLAWVVLACAQFVTAYLFLGYLEDYLLQQGELRAAGRDPGLDAYVIPRLCVPLSTLVLFLTPLLSMRAINGERRNATLTLLFSAPVSELQIVLGKYLAVLVVASAMLATVALMPATLALFAPLDTGLLAANLLGVWFCGAAAGALGLYCSALARQPAAAAIMALAAVALLWLIGGDAGELTAATRYLSLPAHLRSFLRGAFDSGDAAYFVLLIGVALALSVHRLRQLRASG
jgi:ABC-2 type transport system permease protein